MGKDHTRYYYTSEAERDGTGVYDLMVIDMSGEAKGYVFPIDFEFGQPSLHTKTSPSVPLNIGSSTPAQAGGLYDVRDAEGPKAITHLSWHLGQGQKSLDTDEATPYKYDDAHNVDISEKGALSLMPAAVYVSDPGRIGPFISALGYLWSARIGGGAEYTTDGTTWTASTGLPTDGNVSSFCTDGRYVYASVQAGTGTGVYKSSATAPFSFTKIGASSTERISNVVWHNGLFYGAKPYVSGSVASVVAMLDSAAAYALSSTVCTPAAMADYTTVELVVSGNAVYWVVYQGQKSYVYKLMYDPDADAMSVEQYAEFPTGFIATCAFGYLSDVYVGGYWASETASVGQGQVYDCSDGYSTPLFTIGELPEDTNDPDNSDNDNRIMSMTAGVRYLYVNTNRAVYRWDIDDGGLQHCFDLTGSGEGVVDITWDSGSDYSWDGTDYTTEVPAHGAFPTYWTMSTLSGTPVWAYGSGIATLSGGNQLATIDTITLDNTTGTTIEVKTGDTEDWANGNSIEDCAFGAIGYPNNKEVNGSRIFVNIRDGAREGLVEITNTEVRLHKWSEIGVRTWGYYTTYDPDGDPIQTLGWYYKPVVPAESCWTSYDDFDGATTWPMSTTSMSVYQLWKTTLSPEVIAATGARTIRITMSGTTMAVTVGNQTIQTDDTRATTDSDQILFQFDTNGGELTVDHININSDLAIPPGNEIEIVGFASLCWHNNNIYTPYNVPSYATTNPITSSSKANPCVITSVGHGFVNNDSVVIEGNSVSGVNGTWTVTKLTNDTFSIPYDNSGGSVGTGGLCHLENECAEGYAYVGTAFAADGWIRTSRTNFHTGSMLKDFRYVDIAHDPLPGGAAIECSVELDGKWHILVGEPFGDNHTRFYIDKTGYSTAQYIHITKGSVGKRGLFGGTPRIHAVNVVWDFQKTRKHQYVLDCRTGAKNGIWKENPQEAISFLCSTADRRASFIDVFNGRYNGTIEEISFTSAHQSLQEGPSGIVTMVVRQED